MLTQGTKSEHGRVLEKTGMRVTLTPTCSEGLRVKPFHSVNISLHQESKFQLSCMNAIYKIHKIHNPLSPPLRLSPTVSAKHGEENITKRITVTASLLLLLFNFLITSPNLKKKKPNQNQNKHLVQSH